MFCSVVGYLTFELCECSTRSLESGLAYVMKNDNWVFVERREHLQRVGAGSAK